MNVHISSKRPPNHYGHFWTLNYSKRYKTPLHDLYISSLYPFSQRFLSLKSSQTCPRYLLKTTEVSWSLLMSPKVNRGHQRSERDVTIRWRVEILAARPFKSTLGCIKEESMRVHWEKLRSNSLTATDCIVMCYMSGIYRYMYREHVKNVH